MPPRFAIQGLCFAGHVSSWQGAIPPNHVEVNFGYVCTNEASSTRHVLVWSHVGVATLDPPSIDGPFSVEMFRGPQLPAASGCGEEIPIPWNAVWLDVTLAPRLGLMEGVLHLTYRAGGTQSVSLRLVAVGVMPLRRRFEVLSSTGSDEFLSILPGQTSARGRVAVENRNTCQPLSVTATTQAPFFLLDRDGSEKSMVTVNPDPGQQQWIEIGLHRFGQRDVRGAVTFTDGIDTGRIELWGLDVAAPPGKHQ